MAQRINFKSIKSCSYLSDTYYNQKINNNVKRSNLYIKIDKYKTEFNFYNFNKFKLLKTVPITYKSPTIFLDGLYFKLDNICKIIKISNDSTILTNYNLLIEMNKEDCKIFNLFKEIDNYNYEFFNKHKDKFKTRIVKSIKSKHFRQKIEHNLRDKSNPLIKLYLYTSFFILKDNKILMNLNITHNLMLKILHNYINILYMDYNNNEKQILEYKNLIYSLNNQSIDLKNTNFNLDIKYINLYLNLWISCNSFIVNEQNMIEMLWLVSDYLIS